MLPPVYGIFSILCRPHYRIGNISGLDAGCLMAYVGSMTKSPSALKSKIVKLRMTNAMYANLKRLAGNERAVSEEIRKANLRGAEVRLEVDLTGSTLASGDAKFEDRLDRNRQKFSVEVEDGPANTTVRIEAGGMTFFLGLDGAGFGDLNLDTDLGDTVPSLSSGDLVQVFTNGTSILSGVLAPK